MAEPKELETLVYCLGPIGGQENPVFGRKSLYTSKFDYTTNGYDRYIDEAKNLIKFQNLVVGYFAESVKSEFENDPFAFIDAESEEDLQASIQKMKKQWRDMFKDHQKKIRETLHTQKQAAIKKKLAETSCSSAKLPRLEPQAAAAAAASTATVAAGVVGIPVQEVDFPESIFLRKAKEFGRVLKTEYLELKAKMGKALDRISRDETAHDLKGFTFQNMEKLVKWKYDVKMLDYLVSDLKSKLGKLDLDFDDLKAHETRLTDWMYFDDGRGDRRYHHRILITMQLTVAIEEISALAWKLIRRWKKIGRALASKLPVESAAFEAKVTQWGAEILNRAQLKRSLQVQKSIESDDTAYNVEEMPEET